MSLSRVRLLDPGRAKEVAEAVRAPSAIGDLLLFRALLVKPRLARAVSDLLTSLLFKGDLDARLRELIIMRVAWVTGSVYEWASHWPIATTAGASAADLIALRDWRAHSEFDERERASLAAADEVVACGQLSDTAWAALVANSPEDDPLEIIAVISTWFYVSVLLRSLNMPLEDGMTAWPPDGVSPIKAVT